jgi:hypothetical protein
MSVPVRLLTAVVLALATRVAASVELEARVEAVVTDEIRVRLVVDNRGDDPARAVAPEIRYRMTERHPDPAPMLRGGAQHVWDVTFPRPATAGTDTLVILVRHRDTLGQEASLPYATTVPIDETAGPVRLALAPRGSGSLPTIVARLTHDEPAVIRGRFITVLPDGYYAEPGSQAVEVPPGPGLEVPFVPQRLRGPLGARIPVAVILQYEFGGVRRAAAATVTLRPGPPPAPPPVSPLVVGGLALGTVVFLLCIALLVSARRRRSAAA